jgi:hypothetical protein
MDGIWITFSDGQSLSITWPEWMSVATTLGFVGFIAYRVLAHWL